MITYHIIIKYSDANTPKPGTIELHNEVIMKYNEVLVGKFGKKIGAPMLMRFKNQISDNHPTYLFLANFQYTDYLVHVAEIKNVLSRPSSIKLIPKYYKNQSDNINTWFHVNSLNKCNSKILNILNGASSKMPIGLSIRTSMSGMFYVTADDTFNIREYMMS